MPSTELTDDDAPCALFSASCSFGESSPLTLAERLLMVSRAEVIWSIRAVCCSRIPAQLSSFASLRLDRAELRALSFEASAFI